VADSSTYSQPNLVCMDYPAPTVLDSRIDGTEGHTPRTSHDVTVIPPFSHTAPSKIRGRKRWPLSLEAQAFPENKIPTLLDVLVWVEK
jgi:hypothetical protein